MFTPLEILYIVLAFCVLWLSAAMFWLIWQVANILKNVNSFLDEAKHTLEKIENSISSIRDRVEHMTSASRVVFDGLKAVVDYVVDRKRAKDKRDSDS
jgi:uncharacterized protein YoxC